MNTRTLSMPAGCGIALSLAGPDAGTCVPLRTNDVFVCFSRTVSTLLLVLLMTTALHAQIRMPSTTFRTLPRTGTDLNTVEVRRIEVQDGKLVLVTDDDRRCTLPDGTYATSSGDKVVVRNGRIVSAALDECAGPGTSPAAARGRYRVTITGFEVRHETWDHALEVDGKRDEVYVTVDVTLLDKAKGLELRNEAHTKIMGDVNGFQGVRVKAGSASGLGGIRTGDHVPSSPAWKRRTAPTSDRLPLNVWEGELVQDENVVVMIPAIWEYDGGKDVYGEWVGWAQKTANTLKRAEVMEKLLKKEGMAIVELAELGLSIALSLQKDGILGQAQDRPIGLKPAGSNYKFDPKAIVLNYDTAEFALRNNVGGRGPGIIAINYKDESRLAGDYILYVQIERLR